MQYGPLLKKSGRYSTEPTTGDHHSTECEVSFYFALWLYVKHNRVGVNTAIVGNWAHLIEHKCENSDKRKRTNRQPRLVLLLFTTLVRKSQEPTPLSSLRVLV